MRVYRVDFDNMTSDQRTRFAELIDRAAQLLPEIVEMYDYGILSISSHSGIHLNDEAMSAAFPDAENDGEHKTARHNGARFFALL